MKQLCVIGLLVFSATALFAQKSMLKVAPLGVSRSELAKPITVKIGDEKNLIPKSPFASPFSYSCHPPESYTAFFCRMELRSVQTTGVWFKVHAGDYDAYSHKRW